jgi:gliding motility-associated lipoprotein GldH
MRKTIIFLAAIMILSLPGCRKEKDYVLYHKFPDHTWNRFNTLQFEIPMRPSPKGWDILFYANHTKDYAFDNLDFYMRMVTPSGEERIKDYNFPVKRRDGGFIGQCRADSCTITIPIKKEIYLPDTGILKIQIETIVPRMEIKGLLGVGIRMHPRGE